MRNRRYTASCLSLCLFAALLSGCSESSTSADTSDPGPPVYIFAGTGRAGYGEMGYLPRKTSLYSPQDVIIAPDGSPLVVDWNNHRVIQVDPATGHFKLIAGASTNDFGDPCPPPPDDCQNVVATTAKLNHPTDVAFNGDGDLVLAAWHNSELFLLNSATGLMSRTCGDGSRSYNGDNQPAIDATVDLPVSVAFDLQGRLVFCDQANMIIRRINLDGTIETIAGIPPITVDGKLVYQFGFSGNEGPATQAKLSFNRGQIATPSGRIAYDVHGNLFIADTENHCIRFVDTNGIIHQFAGVGGQAGYAGDGGPATEALLRAPRDIAVDLDGTVYIADTNNHVIRRVGPHGTIKTIVGEARSPDALPLKPSDVLAEDGKGAFEIHLTHPYGVSIDSDGRLYVADTENHVIRVLNKQE